MLDRASLFPAVRSLIATTALLVGTPAAFATDVYNPANRQVSVPTLTVGNATFTNAVLTVGTIVTQPSGTSAKGTRDSYDPATGYLTVPAVTVGGSTFFNAVVTVSGLDSAGTVTGADTYDGSALTIPSIQVGNTIYDGVVVAVASIVSHPGGMPTALADSYNPSNGELTIPAVQVLGGSAYTNVTIKVGAIKSIVSSHPVPPAIVSHRITLAGDSTYAYVLLVRADGSIVTAGNMPGGNPTPINGTPASLIASASPAAAVSVDPLSGTSFALQASGTVLGWGVNFAMGSQPYPNATSYLGVVETIPVPTIAAPVVVAEAAGVVELKALEGYGLTRHADGSVWLLSGVSSYNYQTAATSASALQLQGLASPIVSIGDPGFKGVFSPIFPLVDVAGNVTLAALTPPATTSNGFNYTYTAGYTLAPVGNLPKITQVSCGDDLLGPICLALSADGTVWAWGTANGFGQVGNGTTTGQTIPVLVAGLSGIVQVAVNSDNSYALAANGTVYAWGDSSGLGQAYSTSINSLVPNLVPNLTGIVEIAARGYDIIARDANGVIWGWGTNAQGELGTGNTAAVVTPTKFPGITLN